MKKSVIAIVAGLGALAISMGTAAAQSRYCDGFARDYADQNSRGSVAGGAVAGGVMGAVGGAVLGGIINGNRGAGTGAAIGGASGALIGAGQGSRQWQSLYDQAYNDCMIRRSSARPAPPPPPPGAGFRPWTPEWYDYCARRYRSFNPNTGYFVANGGQRQFCR
ncbi:BA14K family protein [Kaistia dalseonensis]|uniref:Lectin-like protein BA14k n=1 Tax=Kaistia dalseonensis TaxID=410840 RepID=A0ABU0HD77_9HYPH|nr:BA14K family protein [Kaistia dalseonensis]MCX5497049.1 BA14K family protein [Kaistia dalseonensis]MDQ0439675.1 MFS family permease [Kaistia dalseonensis]